MTYFKLWPIFLYREIDTLFLVVFEDVQVGVSFLIQDLIPRQVMNENEISIYQNLSLGFNNHKHVRFGKLKLLPLFNGLLNTSRFFYSPTTSAQNALLFQIWRAKSLFLNIRVNLFESEMRSHFNIS